jgi:hypothetical protein
MRSVMFHTLYPPGGRERKKKEMKIPFGSGSVRPMLLLLLIQENPVEVKTVDLLLRVFFISVEFFLFFLIFFLIATTTTTTATTTTTTPFFRYIFILLCALRLILERKKDLLKSVVVVVPLG